MQATFPGAEFLRILFRIKKRKENSTSCMSTSSIKRQIRRFHVVVMQWTSKKCTKKRDVSFDRTTFKVGDSLVHPFYT